MTTTTGKPAARTYRATFSLPVDLATGINRVAKRMGVSQSGLLAVVLTDPIAQLDELLAGVPVAAEPADIKRLRGKSAELIRAVVSDAMAFVDEAEHDPS